ncbi:HEPN domain-containing protein [Histidinibacterium lentulum]|uniref:HEPN domain-containing protein n=1 Tax=Histidinibacterium lentulum TaxID=2480588 RepID=UPI000F4BB526|nr:HEPN domain-containing protein [Histidinibacterium lentulum]
MANKPYSTFEKTVERSRALVELFDTDPQIDEKEDLLRAAVILCVAGFDRYFTSKFCDVLVPHLKSGEKIGNDLFKRLEVAGFNTEVSLRLIADSVNNRNSRPFRKIRTIVQSSLSNHTTHRDDAIDALFLDLGLKNLCNNAEKKCNKKGIVKKIMDLVDIRNAIAHEAHVKTSGQPRSIDRDRILKMINATEAFVRSCDQIIDNRFGIKDAVSA